MTATTSKTDSKSKGKRGRKPKNSVSTNGSDIFNSKPRINVSSIDLAPPYVVAFFQWANCNMSARRSLVNELIKLMITENRERIANDITIIQDQVIRAYPELTKETFPWKAAFVLNLLVERGKFQHEHIKKAIEIAQKGDSYAMSRKEFIDSISPIKASYIGGLDPLVSKVSTASGIEKGALAKFAREAMDANDGTDDGTEINPDEADDVEGLFDDEGIEAEEVDESEEVDEETEPSEEKELAAVSS